MSSFVTSITTGRKKSPEQIVRLASVALLELIEAGDITNLVSVQDDLCKRLSQLKIILYGDGDNLEVDDAKAEEISRAVQEVLCKKLNK
jgi:phage/plasmid primase-like uncharacterized protein